MKCGLQTLVFCISGSQVAIGECEIARRTPPLTKFHSFSPWCLITVGRRKKPTPFPRFELWLQPTTAQITTSCNTYNWVLGTPTWRTEVRRCGCDVSCNGFIVHHLIIFTRLIFCTYKQLAKNYSGLEWTSICFFWFTDWHAAADVCEVGGRYSAGKSFLFFAHLIWWNHEHVHSYAFTWDSLM